MLDNNMNWHCFLIISLINDQICFKTWSSTQSDKPSIVLQSKNDSHIKKFTYWSQTIKTLFNFGFYPYIYIFFSPQLNMSVLGYFVILRFLITISILFLKIPFVICLTGFVIKIRLCWINRHHHDWYSPVSELMLNKDKNVLFVKKKKKKKKKKLNN